MDLKEYIQEIKRTCPELGSPDNGFKEDVDHMLFGMMTEIGELVDIFKKHYAYGKPIDWVNVQEEMGDIMWYLGNFSRITGVSLEAALEINVNKLKARFPEKFTQEKALVRDLEKERRILEGE